MTDPEELADKLEDVVAILTLGLGALAFALGVDHAWIVFVVGWLLLVPLISEIGAEVIGWFQGRGDDQPEGQPDALVTLQNRYANGEIDDEEFERRVEQLLDNETIEDAERRVEGEKAVE